MVLNAPIHIYVLIPPDFLSNKNMSDKIALEGAFVNPGGSLNGEGGVVILIELNLFKSIIVNGKNI